MTELGGRRRWMLSSLLEDPLPTSGPWWTQHQLLLRLATAC